MKRLKRKLASRRGVTLSEMLVTVAILGLVTLAVSVGISSALRVYNQSVALSDAQTLSSTLSQAIMDELRYARDISSKDGLKFTSANYGLNASFSVGADGRIKVGDGDPAHGKDLVGSGAYAGLGAGAEISYDSSTQCFTVRLTIYQGTEALRLNTFSVRALNPPS